METTLKQTSNAPKDLIKVVLFGPECTFKSSLAESLARHYNTVFVKEYSRDFTEAKAKGNQKLDRADVLRIARGQIKNENEQAQKANGLLICDTDLLETLVYSKHYYDGFAPQELKKYALENHYDLYFLTYIDTEWKADGIRDEPFKREEMFKKFEDALLQAEKPYVILDGTFEKRLQTSIDHIDKLLDSKK
ncbi:MAG: ATP-binding protein [Bacteroidota bacterium]